MRTLILAATIWALAGAAIAEVRTSPEWLTKPTDDEKSNQYPHSAIDRSVSGRVVVSCVVQLDTRLTDCVPKTELPAGMGFGEAATTVLRRYARMKPGTLDGKPIAGDRVTIPFNFAAPVPNTRFVIYQPVWSQAPTFEDMAAAWPETANDLQTGSAVLRCRLNTDGALRECIVAGQLPKGRPFGDAAKALAPRFRMKLLEGEAKKYANADVIFSFKFFNPTSPEAKARTVTAPFWTTTLKAEKVLAVYPTAAADAGVKSGRGVADCQVLADGKLTDCKVSSEKPDGLGFGASAVAVARLMEMNPWTNEGRPVGGARTKLGIDFNLSSEEQPQPK